MITTAIMAHPDRRAQAEKLARRHRAWVTWDRMGSRWDTGRRAWLSIADSPQPYGMVLQDDALPVPGFAEALPKMLRHVPEGSPVVLYAGSTSRWAPVFREVPNVSFLVMDWIWWGPGIIMPTELIRDAVRFGDEQEGDQYDHMLGTMFHVKHIPVYYTWPSLVDHARGPSLVPGRVGNRRAYRVSRQASRERWDKGYFEVEVPVL